MQSSALKPWELRMENIKGDCLDNLPVDGDEDFLAQCLIRKIGIDTESARTIVANYRGDWAEMEAQASRLKAQQ
jgi:hypothetical protein